MTGTNKKVISNNWKQSVAQGSNNQCTMTGTNKKVISNNWKQSVARSDRFEYHHKSAFVNLVLHVIRDDLIAQSYLWSGQAQVLVAASYFHSLFLSALHLSSCSLMSS